MAFHITDMTWKRIKHPSEMVQLGQKLEVMILSVDKDKGRVALGLKQKEANPWDQIEQKYPPGTRVNGKIVNFLPYGAFIEIEPGIEGLIHVSEMSWVKNITDPSEVVKKGDELKPLFFLSKKKKAKFLLGSSKLNITLGMMLRRNILLAQCQSRNSELDKLWRFCRIRTWC